MWCIIFLGDVPRVDKQLTFSPNYIVCQHIIFAGDVPRVDGELVVSRLFGDKHLKLHLRSDSDVKHVDFNSGTEFLILATDGLWKVAFLDL